MLPGYLAGTGGGGGSNFSSQVCVVDYGLLPSSAPLIIIVWPYALIGRTLKVFENAEAFPASPSLATVVPEHRRTVFSLFAAVEAPSAIAGLVGVETSDGASLEVFQLSWRAPQTSRGCAPAEAGSRFQFVPVGDAPSLEIDTISSAPVQRLPWRWLVCCRASATA
jgi:hypothetical protein